MGKTQAGYRQHKKNVNKEEAYLEKERERKRLARKRRKDVNGISYKQYLQKERTRKNASDKRKKRNLEFICQVIRKHRFLFLTNKQQLCKFKSIGEGH